MMLGKSVLRVVVMTLRRFLKIWMGRKGLILIQLIELGLGLVLSKGAYSLLVMCRRRMVWFGCHVGEDVLASLLVCSIMGKVPGGEVGKGGECLWFLGGRGTSYVSNLVSLDGFVRLCFI